MDINVEIVKEELEYKQSIIMVKTEDEFEDISILDIKTEGELRVEENQNNYLTATFVKKEPDNNIERIKDQFSSGEADETLYEIKTEELMLKSDDSKTRIHSEGDMDETHICDVSDYKAHRERQLTTHISVEHDESLLEEYGCNQCDFNTNRRNSLTNHVKKHKNSIKCNFDRCEYKTHNNFFLKKHSLVKHDKNTIKKHCCDHCEYQTHRKFDLKNHVMVKHDKNAIKKYGCDQCEYKSHRKYHLKIHVMAKHDMKALKKYGCDHCEYKSHTKYLLKSHELAKHDKNAIKKYSCDHCEYKTHNKRDMERHVMAKHTKNGYGCDHCEYRTHEKIHFDVHVLIHDKNALKKYGCDHCEYRTHFKNALKMHVLLKHDTNAIKNTAANIVNTNVQET